jgi:MerC mercury resistance protein
LFGLAYIGPNRESRVLPALPRNGTIDRMAIGLSGLCLVHCVASAVLVMVVASAGGLLLDPRIHEVGLVFAMLLGALGLGRGVFDHGFMLPAAIGALGLGTMAGALTLQHGPEEVFYSVFGVLILALGHDLNRRAVV